MKTGGGVLQQGRVRRQIPQPSWSASGGETDEKGHTRHLLQQVPSLLQKTCDDANWQQMIPGTDLSTYGNAEPFQEKMDASTFPH